MPETSASNLQANANNRVFGWSLFLLGALGWWASFSLTLDKFKVLTDPAVALGCDISPFISCKSVMASAQAALFGFPNPLIGVASFVVPIVVGTALLAGAKFMRWFWLGLLLGHSLGFAFVVWLFTQALYDIGALCPWCMVAWSAMIPLFWALLGFTAKEGFLGAGLRGPGATIFSWAWVLTAISFFAIGFAILIQFWEYWITLI